MRCALALVLLGACDAARSAGAPVQREVAITFDDVPGVQVSGGCDHRSLLQLNRKLIAAITRNQLPAIGLVVEQRACAAERARLAELLRMWRDAGLELGNHSYSHFDLNTTPMQRYQADIIRGEATTRRVLEEKGKTLKYFRHPFLHAGKDLQTKRALEKFLDQRGYEIAPVTIDNQEWVFADVYVRAQRRGDRALMRRIGTGYVAYMDTIFQFFERRSLEVLGYEVKQVLLLHDNPLNADYLDELVQMMKRRNYRFISLDQALTDPAYRLPDNYAGPRGLSWLHRWSITRGRGMAEEPREPEWIRRLFEAR